VFHIQIFHTIIIIADGTGMQGLKFGQMFFSVGIINFNQIKIQRKRQFIDYLNCQSLRAEMVDTLSDKDGSKENNAGGNYHNPVDARPKRQPAGFQHGEE